MQHYEERHLAARRAVGQGFLGLAGLARQQPTDRPAEPSSAPRTYVLCQEPQRQEALEEAWQGVSGAYRQRYRKYRAATELKKRIQLKWPPWTCPPTLSKPVGYEQAA